MLVMKCDDPPVPSNGDFVSNGSIVTYMCEEGFVLIGNRQRFCNLTTWMWNGSDPTCEGICACHEYVLCVVFHKLLYCINHCGMSK